MAGKSFEYPAQHRLAPVARWWRSISLMRYCNSAARPSQSNVNRFNARLVIVTASVVVGGTEGGSGWDWDWDGRRRERKRGEVEEGGEVEGGEQASE